MTFVYFCAQCGERDPEVSRAAADSRARTHNINVHKGRQVASYEETRVSKKK